MKTLIKILPLLIILTITGDWLTAQSNIQTAEIDKKTAKYLNKRGELLLSEGKYKLAAIKYLRLLAVNPNSSLLNYKVGYCYLNTVIDKYNSIQYFNTAIENLSDDNRRDNAPDDVYLYLVRSYRVNYLFSKTIEVAEEIIPKIKSNSKLLNAINEELFYSINGLDLMQDTVGIEIQNLGIDINSRFEDHSPVLNADESVIIFTSDRYQSTGAELSYDGMYNEDIFISYKNVDGWTKPQSIGENINTPEHEATIGLSHDGQELYIYKSDDEDGNIYVSRLDGDIWSVPEKLGENINTKDRETHACLSADGNELFFTSKQKGGYGGLDIYVVRKLPNGKWGLPENLGPTINTKYDEEGPFIHPDGITLYFSSKGHVTMGGFDIFYAIRDEDSWSTPRNVGYPINTPEDDVFYILSPDGKRAYYSSHRPNGYGGTDLYMINLTDVEEKQITVVSGIIELEHEGKFPEVSIRVIIPGIDEAIGIYHPNTKTGKYLFILNRGINYNVTYYSENEIVETVDIPLETDSRNQIVLDTLYVKPKGFCYDGVCYDEQLFIRNILFPSGRAPKIKQNEDLNKLAKYLLQYPKAVIEIGAYADASGSESFNLKLTQKRANSVRDYLLSQKVKKRQLIAVGYGESNPVAINKNPDGTWNKESQRYNRRIEFKVIKQGEATIVIKDMDNIPKKFKIVKQY